mgnify:CR=1 FL=1
MGDGWYWCLCLRKGCVGFGGVPGEGTARRGCGAVVLPADGLDPREVDPRKGCVGFVASRRGRLPPRKGCVGFGACPGCVGFVGGRAVLEDRSGL